MDTEAIAYECDVPGVSFESAGYDVERSRKIEIVAVEPTDNLASRHTKALVDRIRLPVVGFRNPVCEVSFVALDDRDAFVGAASIDNDVLEISIVLEQHRAERAFNVCPLVVGGRDDADPRSAGCESGVRGIGSDRLPRPTRLADDRCRQSSKTANPGLDRSAVSKRDPIAPQGPTSSET